MASINRAAIVGDDGLQSDACFELANAMSQEMSESTVVHVVGVLGGEAPTHGDTRNVLRHWRQRLSSGAMQVRQTLLEQLWQSVGNLVVVPHSGSGTQIGTVAHCDLMVELVGQELLHI